MKFGYEVIIDSQLYSGFFDISNLVQEKKSEYYTNRVFEIKHNDIVLSLIEQEDIRCNVTCKKLNVINNGITSISVQKANIVTILPIYNAHLKYFTSDWGSEFSPVSLDVTYEIKIGSYSGRSSKGCDPYYCFGWDGLGYLGVSVGWSGNWTASFKRLVGENYSSVGMLEEGFSHEILAGSTFENIEIYYSFALGGIEDLSLNFRAYYKDNISLFDNNLETLPVEFNHWWPYEDKYINEEIFYENAKVVKELGFTNTLLDAGWFGPSEEVDANKDQPWYLKRGDWDQINTTLFPSGMESLGKKVNDLGIKFGIWCEIESVGVEAMINKTHENLIAKRDGESLAYVCMGNEKTINWALDIVKTLVVDYGASWLKFDFNLDPKLGCNCENHGHGKNDGLYAHYKGYYKFLELVIERYPHVIIENCSSGGLRLDYGIMKRSHVAHLSDPDHTKHHMQCYWGALSHIHQSSCLHFAWSEIVGDHNDGISIPFTKDTKKEKVEYMIRAVLTGVPGFSLKFIDLPNWIKIIIKEHVEFYKKISAKYILNGVAHRLTEQAITRPVGGETWNAFQYNSKDNSAIVFAFKFKNNDFERIIKLKDLCEDTLYELFYHNDGFSERRTGFSLMNDGIKFKTDLQEYSEIVEIKSV